MKHVISAVLGAFGRVLIGILVILVAVGILQQFRFGLRLGFGYAVVVSGSMEPNIHVNDVLLFQAHQPSEYHVGDVILYLRDEGTPDEMLISHRIQSIDGNTLVTKGDANIAADAPINFSQVVGRMSIRIPYVGRAVRLLRTPLGAVIAALVVSVLIVLSFVLPGAGKKKTVKTVMGEQDIKY
ncbi:MAG: signal peptidase I [Lachnospiraceae bacterium]|nr:signal peptidase I [Lachnospiraceae bacterium]